MNVPVYDRDAVIEAIDKLHEDGDWNGWVQAENLARALGWTKTNAEGPDGRWLRARLNEVLR